MNLLTTGKSSHPRTSARRRTTAVLSTVVAGTAALALASPASALLPAGTVNLNGSAFPASFSDTGGMRLVPCLNAGHCGGATADDVTAPDGEFFYNLVEGNAGPMRVVIGLEGAFADDGSPEVFSRIRFVARDAANNATYTIVHPYGTATVRTDGRGRGRFSEDTICGAGNCGPARFLTAANDDGSDFFKDNDGAAAPITSDGVNRLSVTVYRGTSATGAPVATLSRFTVQAQLPRP
jgi:hypothetical protein